MVGFRFQLLAFAFATVAAVCITNEASADPITYTETAVASGSLDGEAFNNSLVTLTYYADTAGVTEIPEVTQPAIGLTTGAYSNPDILATVNVSGLGTETLVGDVLVATDAFFIQNGVVSGQVQLSDFTLDHTVIGTQNAAFGNYALSTAIAPTTGNAEFNPGLAIPTSTGSFVLNSTGQTTFSAALASELAGGTLNDPVALTAGTSDVAGAIGGIGSSDFYEFTWGGGNFASSAAVSDAASDDIFQYELSSLPQTPGGPPGTIFADDTLNSANMFTGQIDQYLDPGVYIIGLQETDGSDPNFVIAFNTPPAAVPEPLTLSLFGTGVAIAAAMRRRKKQIA